MRWWFLFLWYSHTHVVIEKIKLIMLENNTNNLNENSIKPNINCHSQCDDHIHYYNKSTWIKKSFSRKEHKTNESLKPLLITQWEFINGLKTRTHGVCNCNFVHPSLNGIPFLCNHSPRSPSCDASLSCRICKHLAGVAPFWEPYHLTLKKSLNIHMHKFIISQISTCKYT
jgi:hypothetical protein